MESMSGRRDPLAPSAEVEEAHSIARKILNRLSLRSSSPRPQPRTFSEPVLSPVLAQPPQEGVSQDVTQRPYSRGNEVRFFFTKGIPLACSAMLNFGIPPLMATVFAGHTPNSAKLQASLGYARVWYNCSCLMPVIAMTSYLNATVPGCFGAGRSDRIPRYLQRHVVMTLLVMIPFYVMQLTSSSIMRGLGVPDGNANDVGVYCRIMVMTSMLTILDIGMECTTVNLGFAKSAAINSIVSGLGVDIACTFLFISQWEWGIHGAAFAALAVKISRVIIWVLLSLYFGYFRQMFIVPEDAEKLLGIKEAREFALLVWPSFPTIYCGWFIFELQVLVLSHLHGISEKAIAAGSVWVQMETALASAQQGWIQTSSMRVLALLGREDPSGAKKALGMFMVLASSIVAFFNVFLLALQPQICRFMTNDVVVQGWLEKIFWVLAFHSQVRCLSLICSSLFVPLKKGCFFTSVTFVAFYVVASPISATMGLTDFITTSIRVKMSFVMGSTSIGCLFSICCFLAYLRRLNWVDAADIVSKRANNDEREGNTDRGLDVER